MIQPQNFLAATLGRVSPRYRTLGQWTDTYRRIIDSKPVEEKTRQNRRANVARITRCLGERTISAIRPHEISEMVMAIHAERPQLAKRTLIEVKDMFAEAVNYGWLDRNPATSVKIPVVHVSRRRLAFDDWCRLAAWSEAHQPPWVQRMLMLAIVTGQRRSDLAKMRFSDIWGGYLHVDQAKTGTRIALPLALRLDVLGLTLGDVVEDCRDYAINPDYLLRKHNGQPLALASLSARFEQAREGVMPALPTGLPPSLHECRSLSERLYRKQGLDTMTLLGHKSQAMTDEYNKLRGLDDGGWKTLVLNSAEI